MPERAVIDVVSIELLLDAESEALVRSDWDALAAAGLSSMAAHLSLSNRPHLTLLVRSQLAELSFRSAAELLPLRITLGPPIVFDHGERGVLARSVELTETLRELHRTVHSAVPLGGDAPHSAPGEWTPHITLAKRLRLDRLPAALALLGPEHTGDGVALRRWDAASRTVTLLSP